MSQIFVLVLSLYDKKPFNYFLGYLFKVQEEKMSQDLYQTLRHSSLKSNVVNVYEHF